MTWTYRCEYVRCGKPACKSCPHGPYWYGYMHVGGKMEKEYIGKDKPAALRVKAPAEDRLDAIFNRKGATAELACEILCITGDVKEHQARHAFNVLIMTNHPDRGGDAKVAARITAAFSFLRSAMGWDSRK